MGFKFSVLPLRFRISGLETHGDPSSKSGMKRSSAQSRRALRAGAPLDWSRMSAASLQVTVGQPVILLD